jgi:SAM-dependent methyltransferase
VAAWNEGYVSEVSYTSGFYREVAPGWMATAALLMGHRPPPSSGAFAWAELGCGQGLGANAFAAAHPQAQFWGFDFNPSHIENARRMANAAGLANAHFAEASFAELAAGAITGLPTFDYIVLHGVWSWVSAENRGHLTEFIRRHLAPGGLVYVSYNVLAGWTAMLPVQRLMRLIGQDASGPAIARAVASLVELAKSDAAYFTAHPGLLARLEQAAKQDPRYLAHEFFNASWDPVGFEDVADAMADAKCGFIGSATLTDNIDSVALPPGVAQLAAQVADPRIREAIRDLGAARAFRRDLYRRGTETPPSGEQQALLQDLTLAGLGRERDTDIQIQTGIGHVSPRPEIYGPLLQRLADGEIPFEALRRDGQKLPEIMQVIAFLLTGGMALPSLPPVDAQAATAPATALNRHIAWVNTHGGNLAALVAPVLGTAITVDLLETLLLPSLLAGETNQVTLVDHLLAALAISGRSVTKDGAIADSDQARAVMTNTVARFLNGRLGLFRKLGILPA